MHPTDKCPQGLFIGIKSDGTRDVRVSFGHVISLAHDLRLLYENHIQDWINLIPSLHNRPLCNVLLRNLVLLLILLLHNVYATSIGRHRALSCFLAGEGRSMPVPTSQQPLRMVATSAYFQQRQSTRNPGADYLLLL